MASREKLTDVEVAAFLRAHPDWRLEGGALRRDYELESFAESLAWVNSLGALAEQEDHHPDIDIRYDKVSLALVTHDKGEVTRRDVEVAVELDALWDDRAEG